MAATHHSNTNGANDKESEAVEAIEELIAEFGKPAMIRACLASSIGEVFSRLGGLATLRVIQVLIRQIAFAPNPQLEAECIAYTTGVIPDTNGTRIAEKYGLSRATISFRARRFKHKWSLPPGPHMKTDAACEVYALSNQPRIT